MEDRQNSLFIDLANRLIHRILEADRRAEKDADIELALVSIIRERDALVGSYEVDSDGTVTPPLREPIREA